MLTTRGSGAILLLLVAIVVALAWAQGGCNSYCANNNQCTSKSCSYCRAGLCVAGQPCSSQCVVNTDCDQAGSCPLCTFGICSSGTNPPPPPPSSSGINATKACVLNAGFELCGPPNTVVVEHNWKPETCLGLSNDLDYRGYFALGCVSNDSVALGSSSTHSAPTPDCGWESGPSNARYPFNKACTAVYNSGTCSGIWDTVIVGYGWSPSTCLSFARAYTGYSSTRLVCTFDYFQGGYSIGTASGTVPPNDCGWAASAAAEEAELSRPNAIRIQDDRSSQQPTREAVPETKTAASAADSTGSKICISYDRTQSWRSTINVSPTWQLGDCYNWVLSVNGATAIMQVGCIFNTTFSLGGMGGGRPMPNCGW